MLSTMGDTEKNKTQLISLLKLVVQDRSSYDKCGEVGEVHLPLPMLLFVLLAFSLVPPPVTLDNVEASGGHPAGAVFPSATSQT